MRVSSFQARARKVVTALAVTAAMLVGVGQAQAQSAIEFNSSGNTQTGAAGVNRTNLAVTMLNNSDNPTGTTFGAVTPAPVPTVTFNLLNQQYTLPTTVSSTGTGLFIGMPSTTTPNVYYAALSSVGGPANANFTSLPSNPVGTGINTATNFGVRMTTSAHALFLAGAPLTGRIQMADLDIDFDVPVTNPVLHFSGMGGSFGIPSDPKGFSSEFDFLPGGSVGVTGITRLSGSTAFGVAGNAISNTSANPAASCASTATDKGACGSVQFSGSSVTKIRLRVYLRASKALPWSDNTAANTGTGDAFHISVSTETADMSPALTNIPAQIVPGTTYTGLTLTCTNAGPNQARNATCAPTADIGTVSAIVCTPAVPSDIGYTAPNNKSVCTFSYTLPVGGTQTQVVFTGQTTAGNDRNGGTVGTAGNNQVQTTAPIRAPKLTLVKALNGPGGRDQATDQFTLTIAGTGGPATTTTGGTGTTVTSGTATLATATAGQTYTLSESASGTTQTANYSRAYTCSNALAGGTSISSGSAASFVTPALVAGDDITCTYTNTFLNQANLVTVKTRTSANAAVVDGETVTFAITITNNGPAVARSVTLTDVLPANLTATTNNGAVTAGTYTSGTGVWTIPTIASGATATLTLEGTVKLGLGGVVITNTTTAATSNQTDPTTTGDDLTESVTVTPRPAMGLVKTGTYVDTNTNGRVDAGDTVNYAFSVTNTGNVTLTNISVTDPLPGTVMTGGPIVSLAPGAVNTTTFTAIHTLTQAEVDAGGVANQATATGTPPTGPVVTDTSDESGTTPTDNNPTVVPLTRTPAVALVKAGTLNDVNANGRADAGDTISYAFTVTNTGNVTLTNLTISDPMVGIVLSGGPIATLAPGVSDSSTFTGSYTITQANVNAGTVSNQATVSGTPPTGPAVTDTSDESGTTATDNDPTAVALTRAPMLALVKTGTFVDVNGNGRADVGDRITYAFSVTNTGNVTLTNVTVSDPLVGMVLSGGPIATLAPGAVNTTTFTGSYTLTQADVNAGGVTNQATASGTSPSGGTVTDTSDESGSASTDNDPTLTPLTQVPSMSVDKQLAVASPTSFSAVGTALTYNFIVTNTGNTTITAAVNINDAKIPTGITCPAGAIAPGASITCTGGSYTTTQADIDAGGVTNTATAYTGPIATPTLTSGPDSVTVSSVATPALTIDKSTSQTAPSDFFVGNTIIYSYLVTNSGNTTITAPITVSDNLISPVNCPALPGGGLLPSATITCTGSYTVTASDVGLGSVTNNATATDGTTTSPSDTVTIPAGSAPALVLDKTLLSVSSGGPTFTAVGQTITYNYQVTNAGTGSFVRDVTIFDDKISPISGEEVCFDSVGGTLSFGPGAVVNCQGTYTVTQADMDAGFVLNEAKAKSIYAPLSPTPVNVESLPDTVTVNATRNPQLTVTKAASPVSGAGVGDTITYTITVQNTGDVTLSNVATSDPKVPVLTCTLPAPVTLAPAAQYSCSGPYVVTQADVDNESIGNTATATGSTPQGGTITDTGTTTHVPETPAPALTLDKTSSVIDTNGNGRPDAGEFIRYNFLVTNTGNQTLTAIEITDPSLTPALVGTVATLVPGGTQSFSRDFTITQATLNAPQNAVTNTATAAGNDPDNVTITGGDTVNTPLVHDVNSTISKTGVYTDTNGNGVQDAGDQIDYSITVTNTGNVTITDATVSDPLLGGTLLTDVNFVPGESHTVTGTYTLVQADINAGVRNNTATLAGTANNGAAVTPVSNTDGETITITAGPRIALVKSGTLNDVNGNGRADVGDSIDYAFTVTNTGNVTLTNISVTDPLPGLTITGGPIASLAPGASNSSTITGSVTLTQAMVNAGTVSNQATASGTPPTGPAVTDTSDETGTTPTDNDPTVVTLPAAPRVAVVKTGSFVDVNSNGRADAGDRIDYAFAVSNTGNVTLTNLTLTDPLVGMTLSGGPIASLAPGAVNTSTFTGSYTLTQADVNTGTVTNQATVSGNPPTGPAVTDTSDESGTGTTDNNPTVVTLPAQPRIALVKTGALVDANSNGRPDAGEVIAYAFTVTNTGNVTLTNISITDPLTGMVMNGGPLASLAPGASNNSTFTGSYTLLQADINAGSVDNQATASGTPPTGGPVTDTSDESGTGTTDNDPTTVTLSQSPAMTIDKRLAAASPTNFNAVGVVLSYEFVVRNTGNVTITDPVGIDDPLIPAGITCPAGPIAPNASITCTGGTHTTTQADIDLGSFANTASAYTGPQGSPTLTSTNTDTVNVPSLRTPSLSVDKSTTQTAPGDFINGNTITYTYVVTNNGNTTITTPITVNDNLIAAVSCPALPVGGLPPAATLTCTGSYTIGTDDLALGSATNNATASNGFITSPTDTVTIPAGASPALSILKTVVGVSGGGSTFSALGDVITYNYQVTNSGNGTFVRDVTIYDDQISPVNGDTLCFNSAGGTVTFAPAAVVNCQATYEVTQADLDRGFVLNEARASSIYAPLSPAPIPVQSPADTANVSAGFSPAITVTKTASPASGAVVGQTITYTLLMQNTGNQTLSNVTADDPMLASLTCDIAAPVTLAPGNQLTCSGPYVVTQADIDAEVINNTATADALSPQGVSVTDTGAASHIPQLPAPALTLDKTSAVVDTNGNGRPDLGETVNYSFVVTNSGNQTLTAVTVNDPKLAPPLVGTIATMLPGASQTFNRSYTLTQADLDATTGGMVNTATVSGQDPDGAPITANDTVTTPLSRAPAMTLVKTATYVDTNGSGVQDAGDTIDYVIDVTNTGNVTVVNAVVSDPLLGGTVLTDAAFIPGETHIVSGSYVLIQGDINAGARANTATISGTASDGTSTVPVTTNDTVSVAFTQEPGIALAKAATFTDENSNGAADAGETITYVFTVKNTGNVTLTNIEVTDPLPGIVVSGGLIPSLAPNAEDNTTFSAVYTLTAGDVAAGSVQNQADVTGDDRQGNPVTDTSDESGLTATDNDPTVLTLNRAPVAQNDLLVDNLTGVAVIINPFANNGSGIDSDPDGPLDPASVKLTLLGAIPGTTLSPDGKTLTVPGQGVWTVNPTTGAITFTPTPGFTADPAPVAYTVADPQGAVSNEAFISLTFTAQPPVAQNDVISNLPIGATASLNPLANNGNGVDADPDGALVPASVVLTGAGAPVGSTLAPDGKTLTVPGQGVWSVNPTTGQISFVPEVGFTTNPTPASYTVADNDGNVSNVATVTLNYTPAPVADADSSTGNPIGQPVVVDVMAGDTAGPGRTLDPATVQIVGTTNPGDPLVVPGEGTWSVNPATGAITFTPEPGFTTNPTAIAYTIRDDQGNLSNTAAVTVGYTPAPVADNDTSTDNPIGQPAVVDVLNGDTAGPGRTLDPATVQIVGTTNPGDPLVVPGEGTWSVNPATGAITFTPLPTFTTSPTPISYSVQDDQGNETNVATVTVGYTPAPIADNDSSTGNQIGQPVVIAALTGDTAGTGRTLDPASVQITGTANPGDSLVVPGEGTWSVNPATGDITFTPEPTFTTNPTPITYRVADDQGNTSNAATVTVGYTVAPVADNDSSLGNPVGLPVVVDVITGDTASTGRTIDPTTVQIVGTAGVGDPLTVAGEGEWTVNPTTGAITFTPEPGFIGTPTPITYRVADDQGNLTNAATVQVGFSNAPIAVADESLDNTTGTAVVIDALGNDTTDTGRTLDPATVRIVGTAAAGDPLTVPGEGEWTVNTTTGEITFTPEPGFTADPTPISYSVRDDQGNLSNTAVVTLTYTPRPPVAQDDLLTGLPTNTPVVLDPFASHGNGADADPDGAIDPTTLVLTGVGAPAGSVLAPDGKTLTIPGQGVWTVDPTTGEITFTPEPGFTANPSPTAYTVADNDGNVSNTAWITLVFTAQPPVAQDDNITALVTGTAAVVDPLADNGNGADADLDGALDPATVVLTGAGAPAGSVLAPNGKTLTVPGQGEWSVNPTTGAVTFTPEAGFTANPTPAAYTVADNDGNVSNVATISLSYVAEPPVAVNDTLAGLAPATPATINPLTNDSDPDGALDPASVLLTMTGAPAGSVLAPDGKTLTVPGEGVWSVNPTTGLVTFTPQAGFTSDPTPVAYTVADNDGNVSNEATITLDFDIALPVAVNDSLGNLVTNTPATINPLTNDSDLDGTIAPASVLLTGTGAPAGSTLAPDGKTLTVPGEGVWVVNPTTGAVTFTPEAGFTANPTPAAYTVADNDGNVSNEATITLTYLAQPPVAVNDTVSDVALGTPVTLDILGNDSDPDGVLDPTTVRIVGATGTGKTLVVAGEGTWTVNPTTGAITFTPIAGFTGDPAPISYTVADNDGNLSNPATVTADYRGLPELDLEVEVASITDTNGNGINDPGDVIHYRFTVTNTGNTPLTGVTIINTSLSMPGLVCVAVDLAVGETAVLDCTSAEYVITAADAAAGTVVLTAEASGADGNGIVASDDDAAAAVPLVVGEVTIEKRAGTGSVRAGEIVPYTITIGNTSPAMSVTTNVVDLMPVGFVYQAGTATVGGVAREPVVNGSRIAFNSVTVGPRAEVTITLSAFVGTSAQPGANTNRARVLNPATGAPLAPEATATVMLEADPVFDCGTVIGRVFDDANQDGYMNWPVKAAGLTNDDTFVGDGKVSRAPVATQGDAGEVGLPGVRLVTVRGTIITTDKYGRFHVPCADLPRDIGSNFLLKLDERTLPTGYRLTTENPRVVRLTAGKMTEMNFGASITRLVRLDLSGAAFLTGKDTLKPRPELVEGLRQMVTQIADTPSMLRLTYVLGQDSEKLGKQRMRAVEDTLRDLWPGNGRYKLNVETTVQRGTSRAGNE